jgi:hypothetical protein
MISRQTTSEGDESMRAGKLITLSAVAVLLGGANLALGQQLSPQTGTSMQAGGRLSQGNLPSVHKRQSIAPARGVYARANPRELEEASVPLKAQERARLRDMVRDIPRLSSVGTSIRIDAVVPKSVRQAAAPLPIAVQRMHPGFRRDRAFIFRDQVVIVNPTTSRIVAIIKTPA